MTTETLKLNEVKAQFFGWLDAMKYRRPNWNEYVTFIDEAKGFFKVTLWTNEFKYTITVSAEKNYIACYAQHRKIRPGDTTPKANDLHSGKIEKATFDQIMLDIVSYELISIFKKPKDNEA